MIAKNLIISFGFLLSKLSYKTLEAIIQILARIYFVIPQKRKRILLSNLTHVFPQWPEHKIKDTANKSLRYLFEMGFFSLIYPHLSCQKRRRTLMYSKKEEDEISDLSMSGKPTLILLPHLSLFETVATSPAFRPSGSKNLGAIYRPNSNPSIDKWINKSRMDLGLKVFSRKKGLIQAKKHLKDGNWLILLFDQNAGIGGELSLFLNRICSVSPLPDIVVKGMPANVVLATPFRSSFFRAELKLHNLGRVRSTSISKVVHQKLETIIKDDPDGLPEWLWSHGKWKTQDNPHQIFHLHSKRSSLSSEDKIPRKTKIWIRMPNWLGDIVMALPLIRAIERGRPDAEITLICQSQYQSLLDHLNVGHRIIVLPSKGLRYFPFFWKLRRQYPDVHFLFTNSLRGDLEAYLCGAPLRLGGSTKKKRKLLSHQALISKEFDRKHQTELWGEYLKFFGLNESIDCTPFDILTTKPMINAKVICLAPGSSNTPEKRWPIDNWVQLLKSLVMELPNYEFRLVGTSNDAEICSEIYKSTDSPNVYDYSGKTNLVELCGIFQNSSVLLCNDSGAMHLANSLGIPVVAIFGVTKSEITGPIFDAPRFLLDQYSPSLRKNLDIHVANIIDSISNSLK
jgi:ADP-heptose:LPS heptosyltransferase/lauroyl/myristoyl acyltransferase